MKELTNEYMQELEDNYKAGMDDCFMTIKRLYELASEERYDLFGIFNVPTILDKYDITDIREKLNKPDKALHEYFIIKGICENSNGAKMVCAMSSKLKFKPTDEMIEAFLLSHSCADFAYVDKMYVRE